MPAPSSCASSCSTDGRPERLPARARQFEEARGGVHRTFTTIGTTDRVPILAHLPTLCAELSSSVGSEIRLESRDEVEVSKAQILAIGLIVNELVTNAQKHAGDPISVAFRRVDPTQNELSVLDSGPASRRGSPRPIRRARDSA